MEGKNKKTDYRLLIRIFKLSFEFKKALWVSIILTLLASFLGPIRPILIQKTIDNYIAFGDKKGLIDMISLISSLLILQTIVLFFQTYATNWLGQSVVKSLRDRVFQHIGKLKMSYFNKTPVGRTVTRVVGDIETIAEVFASGLISISGDLLMIIFIVSFMVYQDLQMTLISLSVLPILLYASQVFRKGVKYAFEEVRTQVASLNAFVQERISGIHLVQIFNREQSEFDKFKTINKKHLEANKKSVFHHAIYFPIVEIITSLSMGLVVLWGVKKSLNLDISPGLIVAFYLYIQMFFRPIRMIANRFNQIQMGMVSAERIYKLLDAKDEIELQGNWEGDIHGNINFKNVWFAYNDEDYILKNISFALHKGETLALVGATGAGKSSIINLISKFYSKQKGEIFIDGTEIENWNLDALRSQMAIVLQDIFLFSGSIRQNINITEKVSIEKIKDAAIGVGASSFIENLPNNYDFDVMERGSALSTGQRQLISFIRALAFDPKLLILDEATSSVDSETESLIQHAISRLLQGRTSIVIAHRLSTIQHAHMILVMNQGEIVERGNHTELMKKRGYYYDLHQQKLELA